MDEESARLLAGGASKPSLTARDVSFAPARTWMGGVRREAAEGVADAAVWTATGSIEAGERLRGDAAKHLVLHSTFDAYLACGDGGGAAVGERLRRVDLLGQMERAGGARGRGDDDDEDDEEDDEEEEEEEEEEGESEEEAEAGGGGDAPPAARGARGGGPAHGAADASPPRPFPALSSAEAPASAPHRPPPHRPPSPSRGGGGGGGGGGRTRSGGAAPPLLTPSRHGAPSPAAAAKKAPKPPRKFRGTLWMAERHPLGAAALLPLLEVCASVSKHFGKARARGARVGDNPRAAVLRTLNAFVARQSLSHLCVVALSPLSLQVVTFLRLWTEKGGPPTAFPVRIQVPLLLSVYAHIAIRDFALLSPSAAASLGPSLFTCPPGYKTTTLDETLAAIDKRNAEREAADEAREPVGGDAEGRPHRRDGGGDDAADNRHFVQHVVQHAHM